MGWGIDFKSDIYLSRQSYSTKYEVEDKISELDNDINNCEVKLKMFGVANPRDIVPSDSGDHKVSWLNYEINEVIESYKDLILERYNLSLYLEYLNGGGEIIKVD